MYVAVNFHYFWIEFSAHFGQISRQQLMLSWRIAKLSWRLCHLSCPLSFLTARAVAPISYISHGLLSFQTRQESFIRSWRLTLLTAIPDGRTVANARFRGWSPPSGSAVRNGNSWRLPSIMLIFPDALFLKAYSWRSPSGIHVPDGFSVFPDGLWPSGIFHFGVV